jgi:acetyl-CoA carboxylase alpha subunit
VARHPQRPHCLDYIQALVPEFIPFAGDRKFSEDEGHRRRLRPLQGREHLRHRPREGLVDRKPAQA